MQRLYGAIMAVCLLIGLHISAAAASQSAWQGESDIVRVRMVSAVAATGNLDQLPLGLEFEIAAGWKIYWRTPGEAGLPPSLDLGNSPTMGLDAAIRWPMPKRFDVFGFDNFGYEQHVILPFDVDGHVAGAAVQIAGQIEALACSDICVPVEAKLELALPDGPATASPHARQIAQFAAQVPRRALAGERSASGPNLAIEDVRIDRGDLLVRFAAGAPPVDDIFVEGFDGTAFKAPIAEGRVYRIPVTAAKGIQFNGGPAVVSVVAGDEMAEFNVIIGPSGPSAAATTKPDGGMVMLTLGIAFLGGLILNLMPCVLPVLALKLSTVLGMTGRSRTEVRLRFLAGAAGIITSFLILALALVLVRQAGGQIGWGIQFQNPVFLGIMIGLLGIFALSLVDFITIPVPRFAAVLARPSGPTGGTGLFGDFLAGMLATILATPCSAPFVGTAVTVALTGSTASLFGIFLAMGFGLAAPWIGVAIFPASIGVLPRPGPWMIWMKRVLALFLVATMVWLGTILLSLLGPEPLSGSALNGQGGDTQRVTWQVFNPDDINQLVADRKTVFVDVTADWCITCKANKAFVLDRGAVAARMQSLQDAGELALLQADWTAPDADIAAFLASHGRFGIPFNIVYGPSAVNGIVLPELLTGNVVLEALERAGKTP